MLLACRPLPTLLKELRDSRVASIGGGHRDWLDHYRQGELNSRTGFQ
jgi:hypothetical protein